VKNLGRRVLLVGLALLAANPAAAQEAGRPSLQAGSIAPGFRMDGLLDEPQWRTADSIAGLAQVEPMQDGPPSHRTVVKVLASPDALVIGVRAYDDPGGIVSFARAPDAELGSEDHVRVVLDTFLDGRTGYVFAVNPTGARFDALVAGQGESENARWDGIWEAATHRDADGWSVEIRIPVRSLIFEPGLAAWGFNVERRIQRSQETDRWASPARDFGVTQVSRAGYLTDLPAFRLGLGLSVRPAFTGGGGHPAPDTTLSGTLHPSVDITQRIGSNLLAALTVNTDFAEAEVDTRRSNLTRFPLFFPEKRTFFLEGSDIFDFGLGLGRDALPFFSRRIGLVSGSTVPLHVGGRLSGRMGGTSVGALVAQTGTASGGEAPGPMGVVRLKQNVLRESSVGMIATFGDPLGRSDAWMAGLDATFQTSRLFGDKNFLVGVWGLLDNRADLAGDRSAAGVSMDYPNDLWDIFASYKRLGEGFDPSLGFVPRPAVQLADVSVELRPRPGRLGIRQCFWENRASWVAGLDGVWQSWRYFSAPINCRFESGDRVEFNWVPQGERLTEPFEVAEGVEVPAGDHRFTRWRLEAGSAAKRAVSGQVTWWFGSWYDGTLHQIQLQGAWKPSALFNVEISGERNIGHLPEGSFTVDVAGIRASVNVSPDLQASSYLQYDSESRSFGTNTRIRWRFSPLGDLFVVYTHNVRDRLDRWGFESNQLLVKAQYAFRY